MATAIGISKKTLVDIEKGRRSLGWTGSVALVCLFGAGRVLTSVFGPEPVTLLWPMLAEDGDVPRASELLVGGGDDAQDGRSGNRWWQVVAKNASYTIEQNIVSQHYRLLDAAGVRLASAFDIDELMPVFNKGTMP